MEGLREDLTVFQQFLTVPNLLTMLRILLFFLLLPFLKTASEGASFLPAVITGAFMLLTDLLDGYFARKLNQITRVGAILDPISDKVIITGLGVALYVLGYIPLWLIALIVIRDLIILVLGIKVIKGNKTPFKPDLPARLTPFSWGITYILFVAHVPVAPWITGGLAILLTLCSGIHYLRQYLKWIRDASGSADNGFAEG